MKNAYALGTIFALGAATSALHAQEATFKAYGFADAKLTQQWYEESNFLRTSGIVTPNTQFNIDNVNTYFDWKPNGNVRFLVEVGLNRNPAQETKPGTQTVFDSAAVYQSIYAQIGASTRSTVLQGLTAAYPTLPSAMLGQMADSITQANLANSVHAIGTGIRSQPASSLTKTPKDHGISLPRVHADLLLRDEFNVRVGRFITPAGIWNVDHGSPAILTVSQPTQTASFPIFPESQTGLQAFGKAVFADQDFSYAGWVSTGRGGLSVLGGSDYGQDPQNLDDWAWGAHLQTDLSVLDGIRLGGTFHTGTIRETNEVMSIPVVAFNPTTRQVSVDLSQATTTTTTTSYARELCYGLDTKIQWNRFLLQGEWNHRKVLNLLADSKETDFDGWYVLASRTFPVSANLDVSPYAMYEWIGWEEPGNNPGFGLAGIPIDGFGTWIGGLNIGLYSQFRVKLEYSRLEPAALKTGATDYADDDLVVNAFNAQFSVAF